jgi:thioredoxin-related protein
VQHQLVKTTNLKADAELAAQAAIPLLVMFSQQDCTFCIKLTEEILQPMLISGDYTDRVLIRELMIDDGSDIVDFSGNHIEPREIFSRYLLFVTPSLLLFDWHGKELAERQIGINTVDYYGYYLDEAIDMALKKLRRT